MLKLKALRLKLGYTQKEFAEKIKLDAHNIGDWERGKCEPSLFWIEKISDTFNVSIDYLLGREDEFGNVNVDASANGLSNEEAELIKNFRLLDDVQRRALSRTAKSFADDNTSLSKVDVKNNF